MVAELSELAKVICQALQESTFPTITCPVLNGKTFEPTKLVAGVYCYDVYGTRYLNGVAGFVRVVDLDSNEFICLVDTSKMEVKYLSPYGVLRFGER